MTKLTDDDGGEYTGEAYNVKVENEDGYRIILKDAVLKGNDIDGEVDYGAAIYSTETEIPLEIELQGKNELEATIDCGYSHAIHSDGELVIAGDGELTARGGEITKDYDYGTAGIYADNDLTLNGGTITVIGGPSVASTYGIQVGYGTVTVDGATVYANCTLAKDSVVQSTTDTINGLNVGIFTDKDISILSGKVYAYGGKSGYYTGGILCQNNMRIDGGEIYAKGGNSVSDSYGIGAIGGITISGGNIYAEGNDSDTNSYGIGTNGQLSISNAQVTAIGAEVATILSEDQEIDGSIGGSYGIGSSYGISIDSSEITATGGTGTVCSYGIGSLGKITLKDSVLVAENGTAPVGNGIGSTNGIMEVLGRSTITAYSAHNVAISAVSGCAIAANHQVFAGESAEDAEVIEFLDDYIIHFPRKKYIKIQPVVQPTASTEPSPTASVLPSPTMSTEPSPEASMLPSPTASVLPSPMTSVLPSPTAVINTNTPVNTMSPLPVVSEKPVMGSDEIAKQILCTYAQSQGETQQKISWKQMKKADGYIVSGGEIGSKMERLKVIKEKKTSYIKKECKKNQLYQYKVEAYKEKKGKKEVIASSWICYCINEGEESEYTNAKKVKTDKTKLSMVVGDEKALANIGKIVKNTNGKAVLTDETGTSLRYYTSKKTIAKIKAGKVIAKKKGKAVIYLVAPNGKYTKLTVEVKKK